MSFLSKAASYILEANYPVCIFCGEERDVDCELRACSACKTRLHELGRLAHLKTHAPCFAAFAFEDCVQQLVHRYKYQDQTYLASDIAYFLKRLVDRYHLSAHVVSFVPLHARRLSHRGFDQAELIAKNLAGQLSLPFASVLERTRNTPSQTSFSERERLENVKDAFAVRSPVHQLRVLLVDDVVTTGATAGECARTLLRAGAHSVQILAFAHPVSD